VGTLIDTSVLIAAERGQIDLAVIVATDGDQDVAIAAISAAELLHGPHRLKSATARARAERLVEQLIAQFPVIDFDLDVARIHAQLAADLATEGISVGAHDLMIAATALSMDYRVATRDRRSFPNISALDVVYW
jgi:tRNA(fMet)-specific endonuclease VapC